MFDRKEIYENHIAPLVKQLSKACSLYQMPFFCTVCVADDESGTSYINAMSPSASNGIYLKDDQILRHINVANGFVTVPAANIPDVSSYDDIVDDDLEEFDDL